MLTEKQLLGHTVSATAGEQAEDQPPSAWAGIRAGGAGKRRRGARTLHRSTNGGRIAIKRTSVALGILGLVWAAVLPASAQTTIQLFGKTYNVVKENRAQTYKNALKVTLPPGPQPPTGEPRLRPGPDADPSKDRLFAGSNVQVDPEAFCAISSTC